MTSFPVRGVANHTITVLSSVLFTLTSLAYGQVTPTERAVELSAVSTQIGVVSADAVPTELGVVVDSGADGSDQIEITLADPGISISLILPDGTAIHENTAAAHKIEWHRSTFTASDQGDMPNPFTLPGTHVSIQLPAGSASGTYKVRAVSGKSSEASVIEVQYFSSSSVKFGGMGDASYYRTGDPVTLTGMLFDGRTPVRNASVTAKVFCVDTAAGEISNYQLISQGAAVNGYITYTYRAEFKASGTAQFGVEASLSTTDQSVAIEEGDLEFGNVAPYGTEWSRNTFVLSVPADKVFDPAVLGWKITSVSDPVSVSLTDSGAGADKAEGDGVYSAVFAGKHSGECDALLSATGVSGSGHAFFRTAEAHFNVSAPRARISAITDSAVTDPLRGSLEGVAVTASVDVQAVGTYEFSIQLGARNQREIHAAARKMLKTGSQQITINFSPADLAELEVDGPYERRNAILRLTDSADSIPADFVRDAGATERYRMSALDRGPISFTGQNTVTTVSTDGRSTYDLIRARIGVISPGGNCSWTGRLADRNGMGIDGTYSGAKLPVGASTITLDFKGYAVAQSGKNGPFQIDEVELDCARVYGRLKDAISTPPYTASQFTYAAKDLTIVGPRSILLVAGSFSGWTEFTVTGTGGFLCGATTSVIGLPEGVSAQQESKGYVFGNGDMGVRVSFSSAENARPGNYPVSLQINCVEPKLTCSFPFVLSVSAGPAPKSKR